MSADHSDIAEIERRMKEASKKMRQMASEVGMAITVIDYDSQRREDTRARYAVKYIKAGESAAAAEVLARAEPAYDEEIKALMSQKQLAESTKKEYETTHTSWETARSLLARQRETLKTLPETEA